MFALSHAGAFVDRWDVVSELLIYEKWMLRLRELETSLDGCSVFVIMLLGFELAYESIW